MLKFSQTGRRTRLCSVDRPAVEVLKGSADRESSPADLHGLQHPRVPQLIQNHIGVKVVGVLDVANINKHAVYQQNICSLL